MKKFLELLNAEIEHYENTKDLSLEEQHRADEEWEKGEIHMQLREIFQAALSVEGKFKDNDFERRLLEKLRKKNDPELVGLADLIEKRIKEREK